MIAFPSSATVWIAGGVTDMRRGMNTLALQVQEGLGRDPHAGEIFCFRGRKGNLVKLLWHDGVGLVSAGSPQVAKRPVDALRCERAEPTISSGWKPGNSFGPRVVPGRRFRCLPRSWGICFRELTGAIRAVRKGLRRRDKVAVSVCFT